MKHWIQIGILFFAFSVTGFSQSVTEKVSAYLAQLQQKGQLATSNVSFKIVSDNISSTSGVHHVYFNQSINGIGIIGTESSVHFSNQGKNNSENIRFLATNELKGITSTSPSISVIQAVNNALIHIGYASISQSHILNVETTVEQTTRIHKGEDLFRDFSASLKYLQVDGQGLRLVWDFDLFQKDMEHLWNFKVNALSGAIEFQEDIMMHCSFTPQQQRTNRAAEVYGPIAESNNENRAGDCTGCYKVFEQPIENPYYGERSIVENVADALASPYGWHDIDGYPGYDFTTTNGNNFNVKAKDGYVTDGGHDLNFTEFPLNTNSTPDNRSEAAVATNVFYVLNKVHDMLYYVGFKEVDRNYQENNYGNGGVGGDPVTVFAQRNLQCTSSFAPSLDGESPVIGLGICGNKDAGVDSDVIIHEFAHGVTLRLVSGGNYYRCLRNDENLAEGFSDWYAKVLTIKPGQQGTDAIGFGNYVLGEGPNGIGSNVYHYSTDMNINPFTYADVAKYDSEHLIGGIWATMLWEVTWALIDKHGFDPDLRHFTGTNTDAGNIRALAIINEALKLMPCRPGFIDARDAILRANRLLYSGESDCFIWDVFAKRGLGLYAHQGSPEDSKDQIEDFTSMPREIEFELNETVCINQNDVFLSGGLPYGGTYSGVGVVDNGDGRNFSIDAEGIPIGTYEVYYHIEDSSCYEESSTFGHYTIVDDFDPPIPECPSEFTHVLPEANNYRLWDYRFKVNYEENCSTIVEIEQSPEIDSPVSPGEVNLDFTLTDERGNVSYCSILLNLEVQILEDPLENDGKATHDVLLYPNPNKGVVTVRNLSVERIKTAKVYDVVGRLVQSYDLSRIESETQLDMEHLVMGLYFITFDFNNATVTKQIIKL